MKGPRAKRAIAVIEHNACAMIALGVMMLAAVPPTGWDRLNPASDHYLFGVTEMESARLVALSDSYRRAESVYVSHANGTRHAWMPVFRASDTECATCPVLVYLHSGWLVSGSAYVVDTTALATMDAFDATLVSVDYGSLDAYDTLTDLVANVARAWSAIAVRYPDRPLYAIAPSSGAFLALAAAHRGAIAPRAVIANSPVTCLDTLASDIAAERDDLVYVVDAPMARDGSPLRGVDAAFAPTCVRNLSLAVPVLVLRSDTDRFVPQAQMRVRGARECHGAGYHTLVPGCADAIAALFDASPRRTWLWAFEHALYAYYGALDVAIGSRALCARYSLVGPTHNAWLSDVTCAP